MSIFLVKFKYRFVNLQIHKFIFHIIISKEPIILGFEKKMKTVIYMARGGLHALLLGVFDISISHIDYRYIDTF